MKLFKRSSKRLINDSILQHRYAVHFSSSRLFKGLSLTFLGWGILVSSVLATQRLILKNSIFVMFFVIFTAAFIPLFIWTFLKGKEHFFCGKPKYVFMRSILAVINYYTLYTSRFWASKSSTNILYSLDTLFVPLLIYIMFRKKLSTLTWSGIMASIGGLILIYSLKLDLFSLEGIVDSSISIISSFFIGWVIIISCYIIRHDPPLRQALYTTFVGMVLSGIGILFTGWEMPCTSDLCYMIIQGLLYSAMLIIFLNACDCIEPHVYICISHLVSISDIYTSETFNFALMPFKTHLGSFVVLVGVVIVVVATRFRIKEEDLILTQ